MLKYSLRTGIRPKLNEIKYTDLYLDGDLSFISGITDYFEGIRDGEEVSVSSPFLVQNARLPIRLEEVRRQGYLITEEEFKINTIHNASGKSSVRYIKYIDGDFFYEFNKDGLKGFLVDGTFYESKGDSVTIPVTNWIENGKVTIDGERYYADMNLIKGTYGNYLTPTIKKVGDDTILKIDGQKIKIRDFSYENWKNVYKFFIYNNNRHELLVNKAVIVLKMPYIHYGGESYPIESIPSNDGGVTYGCMIDDVAYTLSGASSPEEVTLLDDPKIDIDGTIVNVLTEYQTSYLGLYIVLYGDIDNSVVFTDDILVAENDHYTFKLDVSEKSNGVKYVAYGDEEYIVQKRICDYVTINGVNYPIAYSDENFSYGTITVNGEKIALAFSTEDDGKEVGRIRNKVYIRDKNGKIIFANQSKSSENPGYDVTVTDGVIINGKKYPVEKLTRPHDGDTEEYCVVDGVQVYNLTVIGTFGNNGIMCQPVVESDIDNADAFDKIEIINNDIADNLTSFKFYFKSTILGESRINPYRYAKGACDSDHPVSAFELYGFNKDISIYQISDYIKLPIVLGNNADPSIRKEEVVHNDLVNDKVEENLNPIVDMEKDVYYPAYRTTHNGMSTFVHVDEIVFNLHFRTRNEDSWKIHQDDTQEIGDISTGKITVNFNKDSGSFGVSANEDYRQHTLTYASNINNVNWTVIDNDDYAGILGTEDAKKLQKSSDFLTALNFKEDDMKYRKKKIAKSFIRLSYYSTTDPNTQVLLATSTIFMDENLIYKKFMDNETRNADTYDPFNKKSTGGEPSSSVRTKYPFDDNALTAQMTVKAKYSTETSSEGFYLYLFKDYSTELRENTLYLKVEFCHAGEGLVIPFSIPTTKSDDISKRKPLYLSRNSDILEMKKGIPLEHLYEYSYIPINVKYSKDDGEFYYYFPDNLVENNELNVKSNIMMFNLFELKVANTSYASDN